MHICYFCSEYPRAGRSHGGIGRKFEVLARRFAKIGHNVGVIGLSSDAIGYAVHFFGGLNGFRDTLGAFASGLVYSVERPLIDLGRRGFQSA